ncbi:MAG: hypothetical protein R3B13_02930 [Polyangiaceae bacterium]
MRHSLTFLGLLAATGFLLLGCGSDHDKMEKHLKDMRDEITRLQNSQDRIGERLMALEMQQSAAAKTGAKSKSDSAKTDRVERPPLKVIKLAPNGADSESGEPKEPADDEKPRPAIKLRGKEGALLEQRGDARVALASHAS